MTPISASCSASLPSATNPGVYGPTSDPRQQVADDRRQAEPMGEIAEDERGREAAGQRQDEIIGMHWKVTFRRDGDEFPAL